LTAIENITAALAALRLAIENARVAQDVANDPVALRALTELEARVSAVEATNAQLVQNPTWEQLEIARQALHEVYVAAGRIQVVAATAPQRHGGYESAAAKKSDSAISSIAIKAHFERLRASGMQKEIAYQTIARKERVSPRTIRRAVTGKR
jgi:hypothetical protein